MTGGSSADGPARVSRRGFLLALGAAGVAMADPARLLTVTRAGHALGAQVALTVLHERRDLAERAADAALAELQLIEQVMSLYRPDSQLCQLNRRGSLDEPHPYLVQVLRAAAETSRMTAGAFDVTVQPLWELYAAAKREGKLPPTEAVTAARSKVDWRKLRVSERRIRFAEPGMAVTLNGIAQGFAADRVVALLRERGIEHALVNTGEIGAIGRRADGQPWKVGVQHPRVADAYVAVAELSDRFMATSGDYATAFSADKLYNHIFDPQTGQSPREFSGVTIVADTGTQADALATAVFVMGLERGRKLVEQTTGVEGLFALKDGRVQTTKGFPGA